MFDWVSQLPTHHPLLIHHHRRPGNHVRRQAGRQWKAGKKMTKQGWPSGSSLLLLLLLGQDTAAWFLHVPPTPSAPGSSMPATATSRTVRQRHLLQPLLARPAPGGEEEGGGAGNLKRSPTPPKRKQVSEPATSNNAIATLAKLSVDGDRAARRESRELERRTARDFREVERRIDNKVALDLGKWIWKSAEWAGAGRGLGKVCVVYPAAGMYVMLSALFPSLDQSSTDQITDKMTDKIEAVFQDLKAQNKVLSADISSLKQVLIALLVALIAFGFANDDFRSIVFRFFPPLVK